MIKSEPFLRNPDKSSRPMDVPFYRSYLFDGFTLDLTRGCLLRGGSELKLRPKSFKALVYLVDNAGRLISKQELIAAIWPDVTVTDDSLVQCLIEVRKTLGGDAQRYVKTVFHPLRCSSLRRGAPGFPESPSCISAVHSSGQ